MRWALTIIMSLLFVFPSYASDKALVLINGLTGTREYFNQYLGEIQQHGYDPIPIDLYAHGDFGGFGTVKDIIRETSLEIERQAEGYSEISILGISAGGMSGAYYAEHGSKPVKKLGMLISTTELSRLTNPIFQSYYSAGRRVGYTSVTYTDIHVPNSVEVYRLNSLEDDIIPMPSNISHVVNNHGHRVTEADMREVLEFIYKED